MAKENKILTDVVMQVDQVQVAYLAAAANARKMSVPQLVEILFRVIIVDKMVDAIMDDGLTTPETRT